MTEADPRIAPKWSDVKAVFAQYCVSCHGATNPAGNLRLDDTTLVTAKGMPFQVEKSYATLAANKDGTLGGTPPGVKNAYRLYSRNVSFDGSARSRLAWILAGQRCDGYVEGYFPHETTPGDSTTFPTSWTFPDILLPGSVTKMNPAGTPYTVTGAMVPVWSDVPWGGVKCPPDGSPQLPEAAKRLIYTWLDFGLPYSADGSESADNIPPTLTVTVPQRGTSTDPLTRLNVGLADAGSLNMSAFKVVADFPVDGAAAGTDLSSKFVSKGNGVYEYVLTTPITNLPAGNVQVHAEDVAGNRTDYAVKFAVAVPAPAPVVVTVQPLTITAGAQQQTVTFIANVKDQAGNPVNEGLLNFIVSIGDVGLGSPSPNYNVVNGQASGSYTIPANPTPQTYNIWGQYRGTANFAVGKGSGKLTVNPAPQPAATTTTPAAITTTASAADQTITLTATLTPATVNEGAVTFTVQSPATGNLTAVTQVGQPVVANVVNGAASASFTLPGGTAAGTYTVQASYADVPGGTAYATSSGTANLTVNAPPPAATTTAVAAASVTSGPSAQTVTLTATLTPSVSEGTVTFTVLSGTTVIGTAASANVVNGQASVAYVLPAAIPAGTYTVQASYGGTANFAASQGTSTLTVNPAPNPNAALIAELQATIASIQDVINKLQAQAAVSAKRPGPGAGGMPKKPEVRKVGK